MVELAKKSLLLTCLDGRDGIKLDISSEKVAMEFGKSLLPLKVKATLKQNLNF